jgi:hypothetical protein
MPTYLLTSPEGKKYRVTGEGTGEEALAQLQAQLGGQQPQSQPQTNIGSERYAAEDAAQEKLNAEAGVLQQFGKGAKAQMGRFALGATELANNITGNRLIDSELLATAQQGADVMDKGTGAAGFVGNVAGDPLTIALGGIGGAGIKSAKTLGQAALAASKAGAVTGAASGILQPTGNAESDVSTNLGNAAIGTVAGGLLGAAVPTVVGATKGTAKIIGNVGQRIAAGFGSESAAKDVAYQNIAKILTQQGFQPEQVAGVIDEFKAQGIKGGTLGQMVGSSDLLAREKNLLQGGGKAGRLMSENLQDQPDLVSESVTKKIGEIYQPETTSYLYKQAAKVASEPTARVKMGAVTSNSRSFAKDYLEPAVEKAQSQINGYKSEIPKTTYSSVKNIIAKMKSGEIGVDEGKRRIRDLYSDAAPSSLTSEQKSINSAATEISSSLNTALEKAGGEPYAVGKIAAESDRVVREALDAFDTTNVGSLKTALNKFYGSPEKQRDFLDKLPNEAVRNDFKAYLANLEKISGKFGGSDTASNQATSRAMNAESGFGIEGDITPRGALEALSRPISKNVRKAQAEAAFRIEKEKLRNAMIKKQYKADLLTRAVPQAVNQFNNQKNK